MLWVLSPSHLWLQAAECGNQILIAGETDDFQVVEEWEPVTEAEVQTPSEVYASLAGALFLCSPCLQRKLNIFNCRDHEAHTVVH